MAIVVRNATRAQPANSRAVAPAAIRGQRIDYLDNLRALAMLLGVFLHAAFAYAHPSNTFWLATDPDSSSAIDAGIWLIHLFRMSLFYLVAGYFTKLVLERRGWKAMVRQRAIRLIVPFVLCYPFLLAAMSLLIAFGLSYLAEPQGLLGIIADASRRSDAATQRTLPGTMHLWFLYYLIFFTLIGTAAWRFPLLRWPGWLRKPGLVALAPLVLVPGVIGAGVPIPGPESFVPTWWPFAFYGPYFLVGWQGYGREQALDKFRPFTWHLVAASLLLFLPYYASMPNLDLPTLLQDPRPLSLWNRMVGSLLTAYLSASLTLAALLLGRQFLAKPHSGLRFVSDASYWVYLIHLPIVIFCQMLLIPAPGGLGLKLSITLAATLLISLATYVVFVRYTPLGWLLHGKRSFP